ncbi:MAG TPA: DNRLRE domain-containing protein, partial [Thermoplasmata archaeon]|nr:DNRLRE domain-containing protein [Thermoplasmata archaeon]
QMGTVDDTTDLDFGAADSQANVDLTTSPGDVSILNVTGAGGTTTLTYSLGPAQLDDTYLASGTGGSGNFGASQDLFIGYWGANEWNRALLRLPIVLIPSNGTLVAAHLRLYMHTADTPDAMEISVHAMEMDWLEMEATWNDADQNNGWNSNGGDYDPVVVDAVANISTTVGWYEWNVTALARAWWNGTIPNYGLLMRQIDDESSITRGRKQFYSSDSGNVSTRPTLDVTYTSPGTSTGVLESRVADAGGAAYWRALGWSATVPAGGSALFQVRTGNTATVDGTWSPWSAPYATPGPLSVAPARYAQYRMALSTTSGVSPVVHDTSLSYERYAVGGWVRTEEFAPPRLQAWGRLAVDTTLPAGTAVDLAYSADGGASWISEANGGTLNGAPPDPLLFRVSLATNDTLQTPRVHDIVIEYAIVTSGGGGTGFQIPVIAGVPVWVLLIPFGVLAAWTVTKDVRRRPFDATDLFLIHKDGRLIHRAGGEDGPVKDQDAVSAMFTVVAEFVKDSFGGNTNGRGDLKHFRVDDRDVAVAKVDYLFLALVGNGTIPDTLDRNMKWFLRGVCSAHSKDLDDWDGLVERVGDVPWALDWFLEKGTMRRFLWPRRQFRCG